MNAGQNHYTPQPYDPYGADEEDVTWFNSEGESAAYQHQYQGQYQQYQQEQYAPAIPEQRHDDQPTYALRTVEQQVPVEPAYTIPETPDAGWDDTPADGAPG